MAAKMSDMKKNLEDFEREVTCALCHEHYTEPKALPCLHYYCKTCIISLALKKNPFPCPECRKITSITVGKEEELPTAHFINRLKELHAKQEKALNKEGSCEICTNKQVPAEAFCKQCQKFICQRCVESHTLMSKFFDGHEVVAMDKFEELNQDEIASKNPSAKKCHVHKKTLKIYCYQCECLICRDCIVIDHKDHEIEFNDVAAKKKNKDLSKSTTTLSAIEQSLAESIIRVAEASAEIKSQGKDLAKKIEISFGELQMILEKRKKELLKEVEDKITAKSEAFTEQSEELRVTSASINGMVGYIKQCIQHCSDIDIIEMHKELSARIKDEINSHKKSKLIIAEANMELKCDLAEPLLILCQNQTDIEEYYLSKPYMTVEEPIYEEMGCEEMEHEEMEREEMEQEEMEREEMEHEYQMEREEMEHEYQMECEEMEREEMEREEMEREQMEREEMEREEMEREEMEREEMEREEMEREEMEREEMEREEMEREEMEREEMVREEMEREEMEREEMEREEMDELYYQ